ncbi:MAG: DUF4115 domain-containing protein [Actinomycetota bacterium]|nr:DUF4115 domain-containing protein [Actinomycetota bacterium]
MQSIGQIFRNRRQSLNLSLKDIEKSTKIRVRYLQAIENDDYSVLPGPVYARGFIRVYARTLGIDPKQIMEMYSKSQGEEILPYDDHEHEHETEEHYERPHAEERRHVDQRETRMRRRTSEKGVYFKRRAALVILVIGAILISLYIVTRFFAGNRNGDTADITRETSSKSFNIEDRESLETPEEETVVDESLGEEGALPAAGFNIEVQAVERVWLKVTLDGEVVYEDVMEKGASKLWEAKLNAKIRSGNGELVLIKKDGVDIGKLGIGLEEKTFTK